MRGKPFKIHKKTLKGIVCWKRHVRNTVKKISKSKFSEKESFELYSEEKVLSVFMFSHKINNTGYIIVKLYTWVVLSYLYMYLFIVWQIMPLLDCISQISK